MVLIRDRYEIYPRYIFIYNLDQGWQGRSAIFGGLVCQFDKYIAYLCFESYLIRIITQYGRNIPTGR